MIDEIATQTALRATEDTYSWRPQNHWDILKTLLELWDGMDDCTTALHAAIREDKVEIVDLLLRRCTKFPRYSALSERGNRQALDRSWYHQRFATGEDDKVA